MKAIWSKSNQGGTIIHVLPLDDTTSFEVYKTVGGDYAVVCFREGDPCGGDPLFFDSLHEAKVFAESASGDYEKYTLDPEV